LDLVQKLFGTLRVFATGGELAQQLAIAVVSIRGDSAHFLEPEQHTRIRYFGPQGTPRNFSALLWPETATSAAGTDAASKS
jgi:hypothetical protein